MTTNQDDRGITFINLFTVAPKKQQRAADKVAHVYKTFVCNQSGFTSAKIHKSLDGTRVVAIAQWQTHQDFETMQHNPDFHTTSQILEGEIIASCSRWQRGSLPR